MDSETKKWMLNIFPGTGRVRLLTCVLASGFCFSCAFASSNGEMAAQGPSVNASAQSSNPGSVTSTGKLSASQSLYYKRNWGIEVIGVHPVSSGYMLNFQYRIIDPDKAKQLNDMKSKAYLVDEASGTRLAVPAMENVGELRSGSSPEADRTYFMIFGNPGRLVKPGSLVDVVIGNFRVDGLVVN